MRALITHAAQGTCLIVCALLIGCVAGVVPMPTRTRGATGEEIKQKVRTDFIRSGQTSRSDVIQKLGWVNSGLESDQFFLARWSKSNKATFAAACGYINCIGGGERYWGISNALVEFDDQGFVKHSTVFGDQSLAKELSSVAGAEKPPDFSEPRQIWVDHYRQGSIHAATIILNRDTFEVQEGGKKPHNIRIAGTRVLRVGPQPISHDQDLHYTQQIIYFAEKTKAGEKMSVRISLQDLLLLLQFLDQHQLADLR